MPVIFFDIGDTLATASIAADGKSIELTVLPGVLPALEALQERSFRMGIISNPGNLKPAIVLDALDAAGLLGFFDSSIIVFASKDSTEAFVKAAGKADVPPSECVFVGENNEERANALHAGFVKAIPHPSLVLPVLDGDSLHFVSLSRPAETGYELLNAGWSAALDDSAVIPLHISGDPRPSVQVITTTSSIERLRNAGFQATVLGKPDDPQTTDLYLIRDDRAVPAGFASAADFSTDFLASEGRSDLVVGSTAGSLLVAVPAGISIDELHFPQALHGHNERLVPDRSLLTSLTQTASGFVEAGFAPTLSAQELQALQGITPQSFRELHERYIGVAPLTPSGTPVVSRHIRHADNARATNALVDHFAELANGAEMVVRRHSFKHQQIKLENVEAELRGDVPDSFVLITAHLDSTAASNAGGFNPISDPAPGSDDDASGVAAVLIAARTLAGLSLLKKTKRSIRFVLFNAEEQGLVGSKSYALAQAAGQVDIAAVFQMDMIGFRRPQQQPARNFEVHAGTAVPNVEQRSRLLAQLVQGVVTQVSPNLNAPQIYPDLPGGPDPAAARSDHASFQERGYAACVLCEDFFAGPKINSPTAEPNPNYHHSTDKEIDYEYAADIARAVAAAALVAANS